ncbi:MULTISPECIES: hypothetical protein [Flavobacterium]|uniref:DNA-binding protein n=2 Tax=Flavobacterium TaxID=237 RepID=A0ABP7UWN9_9FLAO
MQKEYSNLIIDIQKKSKIEVLKVRDLKYLQEDIYNVTTKNISFNTLRRFFGFLNATTPSVETLNTFALYLGYNSYSNYLKNGENYDDWYFQLKMLRLQLNENELEKNEVLQFNYALQNENNIIAVANYVCFLIEKNKTDSLIVFFTVFDYKKLKDNALTKFALLITFSFYKLATKVTLSIYKTLIPFESFRNSAPLRYIDYSHLNGYYIEVIKMINEFNANESDFLFTCLMEFYQKFYSNEDYREILIDLPKKTEQIYPVLVGRYYGYKILSEEKIDKLLENSIKNELKATQHHLFLIEIIPALVIKDEYDFLNLIIENYYEELFEVDRWSSKSTIANYLIGLASVNISKGNLKAAKNNLELIELEKIELAYTDYITLFYYLTKIKLYFYEKDINKVNENYSKLKELANKIGFYKFVIAAQKYIED